MYMENQTWLFCEMAFWKPYAAENVSTRIANIISAEIKILNYNITQIFVTKLSRETADVEQHISRYKPYMFPDILLGK